MCLSGRMRMKVVSLAKAVLIALTVGAVLAGQVLAAEAVQTKSANVKTMAVMGLLAGQNGKLQTAGPFSTENIYSLRAAVSYTDVNPGVHVQTLKFYTPEGSLYQTVTTAFTARRAKRGDPAEIKVRNMPNPVTVQYTPPTRDITTVWGELPVAGTWIVRLKGKWKVEAFLDDSETAVGTFQFDLK